MFEKTCQYCGKDFSAKTDLAMYCGRNCIKAAGYARRHNITKREVNCLHCQKPFETYDSRKKFCSRDCCKQHHNDNRPPGDSRAKPKVVLQKACAQCGGSFETVTHSKMYCSTPCYRKAQDVKKIEKLREAELFLKTEQPPHSKAEYDAALRFLKACPEPSTDMGKAQQARCQKIINESDNYMKKLEKVQKFRQSALNRSRRYYNKKRAESQPVLLEIEI